MTRLSPRPVIYLAGPDIFRRDGVAEGERLKAICARLGLEGLYPLDGPALADAGAIRANCLALIDRADAVLANIAPFRGPHMDPGTAYEIGYAVARGRPVYLWSAEPRTLRARIPDNGRGEVPARDGEGLLIEDFGLPENLMIAPPGAVVSPGPEAALERAAAELSRNVTARRVQAMGRRMVLASFLASLAAALAAGYVANRLLWP
ncbi:nucleoside 2-deoxyribosyltransferase [Ancylobacter terrae]|uniref:nucleoside 2-deoxyribosyltransferase n=1 Tax=Ancylobacter sp. sgz301288 TaxID=3342077 RepID=UPI00385E1E09